MGLAFVIVGIVSAGIAVFALQNNQPLSLRFITWSLDNVPLAGAILVALAAGLILAAVPLFFSNWRLRSRARAAERKVDILESALATREAAQVTPRPAPVPAPLPSSTRTA